MVTRWCFWVTVLSRVPRNIIEFQLSPRRRNIPRPQTRIIWEGSELTSVAKGSTSMMEVSILATSNPRNWRSSSKRVRKPGGSLERYSTILVRRISLMPTRIPGQWMCICLWSRATQIASEPGKSQTKPRTTFPSSTNSSKIAKYRDPWTSQPTPMKMTQASCTSNAKTTWKTWTFKGVFHSRARKTSSLPTNMMIPKCIYSSEGLVTIHSIWMSLTHSASSKLSQFALVHLTEYRIRDDEGEL